MGTPSNNNNDTNSTNPHPSSLKQGRRVHYYEPQTSIERLSYYMGKDWRKAVEEEEPSPTPGRGRMVKGNGNDNDETNGGRHHVSTKTCETEEERKVVQHETTTSEYVTVSGQALRGQSPFDLLEKLKSEAEERRKKSPSMDDALNRNNSESVAKKTGFSDTSKRVVIERKIPIQVIRSENETSQRQNQRTIDISQSPLNDEDISHVDSISSSVTTNTADPDGGYFRKEDETKRVTKNARTDLKFENFENRGNTKLQENATKKKTSMPVNTIGNPVMLTSRPKSSSFVRNRTEPSVACGGGVVGDNFQRSASTRRTSRRTIFDDPFENGDKDDVDGNDNKDEKRSVRFNNSSSANNPSGDVKDANNFQIPPSGGKMSHSHTSNSIDKSLKQIDDDIKKIWKELQDIDCKMGRKENEGQGVTRPDASRPPRAGSKGSSSSPQSSVSTFSRPLRYSSASRSYTGHPSVAADGEDDERWRRTRSKTPTIVTSTSTQHEEREFSTSSTSRQEVKTYETTVPQFSSVYASDSPMSGEAYPPQQRNVCERYWIDPSNSKMIRRGEIPSDCVSKVTEVFDSEKSVPSHGGLTVKTDQSSNTVNVDKEEEDGEISRYENVMTPSPKISKVSNSSDSSGNEEKSLPIDTTDDPTTKSTQTDLTKAKHSKCVVQ